LFPQKHVVYIFFLCFLALSWNLRETPFFPFAFAAAIITFTAYALKFNWRELLPGAAILAAVLGLVAFLRPSAELPPKVAWIKEGHSNQRVAILEDWETVNLKDENVDIGDYVTPQGELLLKNNSLKAKLERLRFRAYKTIEENIDYPISSVVGACTLGIRYELPAPLKGYFSLSGLYHFLAISGLHVGVVIGALAGLLKVLRFKKPLTVASLLILPLMPLTGLPPSAVRAYLFTLLISIGIESFRKVSPLYILGWVMLITIVFDRFNLSAALSFAAVGGILLAVEGEGGKVEKWIKVVLAPLLFTLPIILYIFGTVNTLSWISTLLVGFIFTPFLISSFASQVTLFKFPEINNFTQLLGELFIRATQASFNHTKWGIIHSEIPLFLAGITFLAILALALWRVRLTLIPPALLLIYAGFNQTIVEGIELHLKGWKLNSFKFIATEGQRYRNCTIYGSYVMPATRKLLFHNRLIDERLKKLKKASNTGKIPPAKKRKES